jgi:hypothetical protein
MASMLDSANVDGGIEGGVPARATVSSISTGVAGPQSTKRTPCDHNVNLDRQSRAQIDEMVALGRTRPLPSRR